MTETKFVVERKYVRGDKRGKRETIEITLPSPEAIHGYLWNIVKKYERNRLHFIVENYKVQRPE